MESLSTGNRQRNKFQRWRLDSSVLPTPLDWEIVNENWVAADLEIITETPSKGDAWIRKHSQPLLTQKWSMKTGSVPTQKWSTKHLPQVTPGFVRAHSPFWFRNSPHKLSHCRLRNHHRNGFHRSRVDSSALASSVDSEKVNKTESVSTRKSSTKQIPKVTLGFISAPSPSWLRKGRWKLSQCRLKNHHRDSFQRWRVDSEALAGPVDSDNVNENGVGADSEMVNETPSTGDAWIRESTHPLLIQK